MMRAYREAPFLGQTPVRQGIAVTALLGVFVAVAIIFTGGSSLFTTPPPSSRATVSAADAVSPAHRTTERIAGDKLASARTADTLGLLHWLSIGYARRDLGKGTMPARASPLSPGAATPTLSPTLPLPSGRPRQAARRTSR
jgi:hypothetical protein